MKSKEKILNLLKNEIPAFKTDIQKVMLGINNEEWQ